MRVLLLFITALCETILLAAGASLVTRGIMELWRAKRYDAKVQRLSDGVNRYDDFFQREKERQRGATRREEAPAPSIEEAAPSGE